MGGVRLCGQVDGVEIDAGRRPIAAPRGDPRAQERPQAAQHRPRAPGGVKRALADPTAIYMCLRSTYTPHLARRSRPSIAPALAPARARSAHRLPHARCYPGPARASAGGDLSARGLREQPRGAFEKKVMPRKSLRARGCPARSATAPAASRCNLSAPTSSPIDRILRAQWRRSCEGTERRGWEFNLRPLRFDPNLARTSSSPASDWYLARRGGPHILRARTQIFLLQAVGASSISILRTVMAELGMR